MKHTEKFLKTVIVSYFIYLKIVLKIFMEKKNSLENFRKALTISYLMFSFNQKV